MIPPRESAAPTALDWLQSHPLVKARIKFPKTPESKAFAQLLWPFSLEFFNPYQGVFSCEIAAPEALENSRRWFVRDGLFGLLWFFRAFPKPGKIRSSLLISRQWRAVVPEAWQSRVEYWDLVRIGKPAPMKRLLYMGIVSPLVTDPRLIKEAARKTRDYRASGEKWFCMPIRYQGPTRTSVFIPDQYQLIFKELGLDLQAVNEETLLHLSSAVNLHAFNLVSTHLLSDNYLVNLILSRGGHCVGVKSAASVKDLHVRLSPHHGYQIDQRHATAVERNELIERLPRLAKLSAFRDLFWPNLYGRWSLPHVKSGPA